MQAKHKGEIEKITQEMETMQDQLLQANQREKEVAQNLNKVTETHRKSITQQNDGTAQILMKFQDELALKDKQMKEQTSKLKTQITEL